MRIVILDTACANLASLAYAIQRLGYTVEISREAEVVLNADRLFLPGVGSAQAAMKQLQQLSLPELITQCQQPVLGICLGMQLLAQQSEEGNTKTLGMYPVDVKKFPESALPCPHMGWNQVYPVNDHPLFWQIPSGSYFYFVHSYVIPLCDMTIAETTYGLTFSAAVQRQNFFGVQFHPERSGEAGARLLRNFLEMNI